MSSACKWSCADGHLVGRLPGWRALQPKLRIETSGVIRQENQQGCWLDASVGVEEGPGKGGPKEEGGRDGTQQEDGKQWGARLIGFLRRWGKAKPAWEDLHTGGEWKSHKMGGIFRPSRSAHADHSHSCVRLSYLSSCLVNSPWFMGAGKSYLLSRYRHLWI